MQHFFLFSSQASSMHERNGCYLSMTISQKLDSLKLRLLPILENAAVSFTIKCSNYILQQQLMTSKRHPWYALISQWKYAQKKVLKYQEQKYNTEVRTQLMKKNVIFLNNNESYSLSKEKYLYMFWIEETNIFP